MTGTVNYTPFQEILNFKGFKIETPDERNKNEDEKMRVMIKGMRAKMRAGTVKTLRRQAILSQRKNSKVFLSSIQIKL